MTLPILPVPAALSIRTPRASDEIANSPSPALERFEIFEHRALFLFVEVVDEQMAGRTLAETGGVEILTPLVAALDFVGQAFQHRHLQANSVPVVAVLSTAPDARP